MTTPTRVLLKEPKNFARIREIRTNMDATVVASVRSPTIRRWLVREFYFVTGKLFILGTAQKTRDSSPRKAKELLKDLTFATSLLSADADHYQGALPESGFPAQEFELLLVSKEASTLYRELIRADTAITKLHVSELNGRITFQQRENLIQPVLLALIAIKQHSIGYVPKTAEQLAGELQIG